MDRYQETIVTTDNETLHAERYEEGEIVHGWVIVRLFGKKYFHTTVEDVRPKL